MAPACQPCNDSKGGKDYLEWLGGKAKKNPAKEKPTVLEDVKHRIEAYRKRFGYNPPPDFESALSDSDKKRYEVFKSCCQELRKGLSGLGLTFGGDVEIEANKIVIVDEEESNASVDQT